MALIWPLLTSVLGSRLPFQSTTHPLVKFEPETTSVTEDPAVAPAGLRRLTTGVPPDTLALPLPQAIAAASRKIAAIIVAARDARIPQRLCSRCHMSQS